MAGENGQTMIPMIAPDGSIGEIPQEQMNNAIHAGFQVGVSVTSPDGKTGVIPAHRYSDALKAGFKISSAQPEQGPQKTSLGDTLAGVGHAIASIPVGLAKTAAAVQQGAAGNPFPLGQQAMQTAQASRQAYNAAPQDASLPERVAMGAGPVAGIDSQALAQAARNRDLGGAVVATAPAIAGAALPAVVRGAARAIPVAGAAVERGLLLGKTPAEAYESAMKMSTTIPAAKRAAIVQTGLEEGIPISKSGVSKIGDLINDLNDKIAQQIQSDPQRPISTVPAVRNLDAVRGRFANQVTPQGDLAQIEGAQTDFLNNSKVAPQGAGPSPGSLAAEDAQTMKQGTYRALGDKAYGELKGARIEAEKALARGLKDELAQQFPEIGKLNARESQLFDLQPVLEKAVNRIGNHQLLGIGTPVVAGATEAVVGSAKVGATAGVLKAVLDNPMVKSRLAIALSKGGRLSPAQAAARVSSWQASLGSAGLGLQSAATAGIPSGQTPQSTE